MADNRVLILEVGPNNKRTVDLILANLKGGSQLPSIGDTICLQAKSGKGIAHDGNADAFKVLDREFPLGNGVSAIAIYVRRLSLEEYETLA